LRTSNYRAINRKRKLLLNGLTINLPRRNDRKDRIAREITGIHTIKNLHQIKPAHLNNGVVTAREASLEKVRVQLLTTTEGGKVLRDQLTFELLTTVTFRGKDDMRIRSIDRTANGLIGGDDWGVARMLDSFRWKDLRHEFDIEAEVQCPVQGRGGTACCPVGSADC